jgi:hypothetical protein
MMLPDKRIVVAVILMTFLSAVPVRAAAETPGLPDDFPELVVTQYGETSPGVFIGWLGWWIVDYYVVLDQSGYPLFYSKTDRMSYPGVTPSGLICAPALRGFTLKDETFTIVDSFQLPEGYGVDIHDFKVLPNGHAFVLGTYRRYIDMSQVVPAGRPDAQVVGNIIQEIDANKHVVFEWHAFDHIPITDSFYDLTKKNIDYAHVNSVSVDPTDNNLLLCFRTTLDIVKVSRSTGEIIWRLGGKKNDFTFIGEHEENAPYYFVGQHAIWRFPNGNLLLFDNGNLMGAGVTESDRDYSRGVEYHLDETNMTATLVWEYRHDPDIKSPSGGRVQPLSNGNILIDWGSAIPRGTPEVPLVTEVSPMGELVYELHYATAKKGARLQKYVWNSPDLVRSQTHLGIEPGRTYESDDTGVTVTVNSLEGSAQNGLAVKKHADATRFPRFPAKTPQVLVERVTLSGFGIDAMATDVSFDVQDIGFNDPARLTVYYRPYVGQGVFSPLVTSYDAASQQLQVSDAQLGEYIFTYPDAPEVALQPILYAPGDLDAVNQTQPVTFEWTSRGFARSFQLQVATDAEFNNLVVDEPDLKEPRYTLDAVAPGATYYWQVNTSNDGGTSAWAARSFTAAAPMIQVTAPNGGEQWQRGLTYFIQWNDNLTGDVVIDLYRDDTLVKTIAQAPSIGACEWEADLTLEPGSNYTIKVKSLVDEAVADVSDTAFTIR